MLIKYRPHVQFQDQTEKLLHLIVNRSHFFYKIPNDLAFDYSKFTEGLPASDLPAPMRESCLKSNLFEELDDPTFTVPPELKFLLGTSTTNKLLKQKFDKIKNTQFNCLDLSQNPMSTEIFSKISRVTLRTEWSDNSNDYFSEADTIFTLIKTNHYAHPQLETINKVMLQKKKPWILVCQNALGTTIGPFFDGNAHHCFHCFKLRFKSNEEAQHTEFLPIQNLSDNVFSKQCENLWMQLEILKRFDDLAFFQRKLAHFDSMGSILKYWNYLPYPLCEVCRQ